LDKCNHHSDVTLKIQDVPAETFTWLLSLMAKAPSKDKISDGSILTVDHAKMPLKFSASSIPKKHVSSPVRALLLMELMVPDIVDIVTMLKW